MIERVLSMVAAAGVGFYIGVTITVWREIVRPIMRSGDHLPDLTKPTKP